MSNDNNLLRVDNLKTNFYIKDKKVEAVRGVSFHVNKGDILGIVGESGSGKSVLMKSVMNILPENAKIEDGKVYFNNIDISSMNKKEMKNIKGKEIAMIFQDPMTALNPLKKVGDHLIEVLIRHKGINKKSAKIIALDILKQVGIQMPEKRINQYPHEFSGGMRQRVLIAMALACNPRLLIADEPTTALGVVASLCNRVVVMYGGLIMEEGLVDEIFYEAKHPYTKALLNSIPKLEENEKSRLKPIKGSAPSILNPPKGCPFADRCQFAFKKCFQEMPKYKDFSETHRAMCFLEK